MKKTIIKSVVAILCTVALCVTISLSTKTTDTTKEYGDYMTEAQAAEYLGISEKRLSIMRVNLDYLDGAFMSYTYVENGEDITVHMYSKQALNDTMAKLMADNGKRNLNFKFLEEILDKQEK